MTHIGVAVFLLSVAAFLVALAAGPVTFVLWGITLGPWWLLVPGIIALGWLWGALDHRW